MNQLARIAMQRPAFLRLSHTRNWLQTRHFADGNISKGNRTGVDPSEPLKYFGSAAEHVRATPAPPAVKAQYSPYIIQLSLLVFLAYFCILREENDIDELLGRDLYDHFGFEASQLKKAYDYNIQHNLPTREILDRLKEIGAPVPPY